MVSNIFDDKCFLSLKLNGKNWFIARNWTTFHLYCSSLFRNILINHTFYNNFPYFSPHATLPLSFKLFYTHNLLFCQRISVLVNENNKMKIKTQKTLKTPNQNLIIYQISNTESRTHIFSVQFSVSNLKVCFRTKTITHIHTHTLLLSQNKKNWIKIIWYMFVSLFEGGIFQMNKSQKHNLKSKHISDKCYKYSCSIKTHTNRMTPYPVKWFIRI